ncbi:MAG: DMT family transporter [Methanosarcinaceae archaeon]|nr:DMT family transporter [Methanosarcinaceae archaeon]
MTSPNLKAKLQVLSSSIIYGFAGIFFVFIKNMNPGTVVFYQLLLGFLVLVAYLALKGELFRLRFRKKRKGLFLLGVCQAGVLISYYAAINYTNVSVSVLLLYTAPIYVSLLSPFLLKERLTPKNIAALLLSLTGVFLVVGPEALFSTGEKNYFFGVLIGLFSGLFYACIILSSRYLRDEYTGLEQLILSTGIALVFLLPYAVKSPGSDLLENLPLILFLGVMITSIGSILYFTGLTQVKAQVASLISLLEPVSAIFCATVLLKDPLSSGTLLGCLLILSSAFLVSFEAESAAAEPQKNSESREAESKMNF